MSPARTRARSTRKKKQTFPRWLTASAPLIGGIVVTPVAIWAASVLAMSGPAALRLLYPYVLLARAHASQESSSPEMLSQWVMYIQFPAYGLVWILMRRLVRGSAGAFGALMVHCVGVAAAILNANA